MATNESQSETGRFEQIAIANGDVVIYDAENHRAWIQSDSAVDPEERV